MIDYSIEEYVIENNQTIDLFDDYDRVKKVIIESDFDLSEDCSNHFAGMKSLEQFEVVDKESRFFTEDGVLFANLTNDPNDKFHSKEMFCYFTEDISGEVLVAFPTNYPQKVYAVPEGTVAICRGAFEATKLEELILPSTLEFVDTFVLDCTDNLKVLRVPNKEIIILDHFDGGYKFDFSIVSSCDSPLSEDVEKMWYQALEINKESPMRESLIELEHLGELYHHERTRRTWNNMEHTPYTEEEKDENRLGLEFHIDNIYCRDIVWPNEEGHIEVLKALSTKESILSYYQHHKNLENNNDEEILKMASFLYLVNPCKLHPANESEADIVIDMMFGENGVNDIWLMSHAGSPSNYEQLCKLRSNDRTRLLDFIGVSTIHCLLTDRAKSILKPLVDNKNVYAMSNYLYFLNAMFFIDSPGLMFEAAYYGDPVSMWMTAYAIFENGRKYFSIALALWYKLSQRETTLPHNHLEDLVWDGKNNYRWIKQHPEEVREIISKDRSCLSAPEEVDS